MVATAASAAAQDTLFFRGFRWLEYLVLASKNITLALADTTMSPQVLAADYPELVIADKPDKLSRYLFVLAVRDGIDFDSLLSRLNSDERVAFAVRCAISIGGYEVYLDNRAFIVLQSPTTRPAIDAVLANMHLEADSMRQDHPELCRPDTISDDTDDTSAETFVDRSVGLEANPTYLYCGSYPLSL